MLPLRLNCNNLLSCECFATDSVHGDVEGGKRTALLGCGKGSPVVGISLGMIDGSSVPDETLVTLTVERSMPRTLAVVTSIISMTVLLNVEVVETILKIASNDKTGSFCRVGLGVGSWVLEGAAEGEEVGLDDGDRDGCTDGHLEGKEDGYEEGTTEGILEGARDGQILGRLLGSASGRREGTADGASEGADDGCATGCFDGKLLGLFDGCWLGRVVGIHTGWQEGLIVGIADG